MKIWMAESNFLFLPVSQLVTVVVASSQIF